MDVQQYRVCVADDNEDSALVLSEGLRRHEYHTELAHTGAEAVQACTKQGIDLILLDVCLPDISGYEVCQRLKADPATRDIVVIFVTVKGSKEDITKGFTLGASDYITKPYNLPMVMVRVDAAMRSRETQNRLNNPTELVQDTVYTDQLTGLRNHRYLLERLHEEVAKAHRYDYPVSCVVFDLDDIKPDDDELGPAPLDDLVAELAMTLRNHSRHYDVLARYDGTLFAAVLPHTPLKDAKGYATKILREVGTTTFADPCFPTNAKLSVGIASCQNGSAHGAEYVLGEAMRSLLQAKSMSSERLVARNLNNI